MQTLLTVALLLPTSAFARPPHGDRPPGPPPVAMVVERHADDIGLDDTVLEDIRAVMNAELDTLRGLHDALRAAHDGLRAEMEADVPVPDAVLAASAALGKAETALRNQRLMIDLEVMAKLTPDQMDALRALRPEPPHRPRPPR